jgi:hypothetical protein
MHTGQMKGTIVSTDRGRAPSAAEATEAMSVAGDVV